MTFDWLLPALIFVLAQATLGITTKLALRTLRWTELLIWAALAYAALGLYLLIFAGFGFSFGPGTIWAVLTGACAAGGLVALFVALRHGEASRVVPITAAYPVVTAFLAVIVLSEEISIERGVGTALVVGGIAVLTRD